MNKDIPAPAPRSLTTSNLKFERYEDDRVVVYTTGQVPVCSIPREDWYELKIFFDKISQPGAIL